MRKEYSRLGIALGVVAVLLGSFLLYLAWPLLTGTTIILATAPIDPFDPFRGQYMRIAYEVGALPNVTFPDGTTVYVPLSPDAQGIWRAQGVSLDEPSDGVFLRGTVNHQWRSGIDYGIEQFFFEQGASVPTRNITVEAKVSGSGQARIVRLLQNGEPIEISYRPVKLTS